MFRFSTLAPYLLVVLELVLALLIGCGFIALGAGGGAWILGGIVAGAIAFLPYRFYNEKVKPNRNSRKFGQILIGLAIGLSLQDSNLFILSYLPVLVLLLSVY